MVTLPKTYLRGLAGLSVMLMSARLMGASLSLYSSIRSGNVVPFWSVALLMARISLTRTRGALGSTVHIRVAVASASACHTPAMFLPITWTVWSPALNPLSEIGVVTGVSALHAPLSSLYL